MDLNYLLTRHQISLVRATGAACAASRNAHRGLARGYAALIHAVQERAGIVTPMFATGLVGECR